MRRFLICLSAGFILIAAASPAAEALEFLPGEEGFSVRAIANGGATATQAGLHPYQLDAEVQFGRDNLQGASPAGDVRDLAIDLPPGLLLNPSAIKTCSRADFHRPRQSPFDTTSGESCPESSQVGTVEITSGRGSDITRRYGLFNLTPPKGVAAQLGFAPLGSPIALDVAIPEGADGTYHLSLRGRNLPLSLDVSRLFFSFWGIPYGTSHDGERGDCLNELEPDFPWAKCSVGPPLGVRRTAYLSLPTRCAQTLPFSATATSWQEPGSDQAQAVNRDPGGPAAPLTGCGVLTPHFSASGRLTNGQASSPSGYSVSLVNDIVTLFDPELLLTPSTRKAVVKLPPGVTINPSVGAGLIGCSPQQFASETAFSGFGAGCPNGSSIGSFSARSALFATGERFNGAMYLATPYDNPFNSLVAVYLVAKLPQRGIQVKLAGRIDPDPITGDLVATFDSLPQIPYSDLEMTFRAGQRSFLMTPSSCGPAVTSVTMTPWAEGVIPHTDSNGSVIESGVEGGPCLSGRTPPFSPTAVAGGVNSSVGSYTPYFIHLTRKDSEQEITSYSLVLPKGVAGKLAGIPFCSDAAIAAARSRSGTEETLSPSCPATSRVGGTTTGYGIGAALTYAPGNVYLAGPYNGAPLSLVTINSATVGPFDLGTIVIRSAFQIDPLTAQLRVDSRASDPIPHIIDGIPLHLRDVRIYMDRPEFTLSPSSCEPSQLISTLTGSGATFGNSADDSTATASSYFQLLDCLSLGFRPRLGMRLRGGSKRGNYPSLRATFASRGARDSNLKRIEVTMPHALFLAQNHIRAICTRPRFLAETCPRRSAYGQAVAHTPLFDEPLRGKVYLRSSDNPLPDLVANLRSGSIRIILEGKIGPAKHGIRVLFKDVPDAPIRRFTMTLFGGKRGLLVNSSNICVTPPMATVRALGQNNIGASFTSRLRGQCGGRK